MSTLDVYAPLSINNSQVAGVAIDVGVGASTTGTQRFILATNQAALPVKGLPNESGVWSYLSGSMGTVVIPAGNRILQITTVGAAIAGSIVINGGQSIIIPANGGMTINPRGNLIAPTIVFTNTIAYFIEMVL